MSEFKTPTDPITDKALTELKQGTEFNLSEKINNTCMDCNYDLKKEDVKEFIKILKEKIVMLRVSPYKEELNKLAGEELI